MATKEILFRSREKARNVAKEMNANAQLPENYESRGIAWQKWYLSDDAVVIAYTSGEGKVDGRFARRYLVKGSAKLVNYYDEVIKEIKL